jgi:predicted metalloprotease with PDZ domain
MRLLIPLALAGLALPASATLPPESLPAVQVRIDMTDSPRHVLHVTELLPAHAGDNTFNYPQWIPGEHLPGGPIDNLTGIVFHSGALDGHVLPWRRDLVDMYEFHVKAPAGVRRLAVSFDILEVPSRADTTAVDHMNGHVAMLENSDVILYPSHTPSVRIPVTATVHLPASWSSATALRTAGQAGPSLHGQDTTYETVSLDQFVDSPILSGDHCRQYPLAPEIQPAHTLDVCAEDPKELDLQPAVLDHMNGLVRQNTKLFVGHHYKHYDYLVGISKHLDGDSLEHGQSADYILKTFDLKDPDNASFVGYLLPHENIHSWCGKYRRPADLATPDFHTPMQDDLLWVYEGLTEYYGIVMAVRSGFMSPEDGTGELIKQVNIVDRPGRLWRPLQDTADASSILRGVSQQGASWRLSQDYYYEGALVWLEVDMKIRELSHGTKSLDDFASSFLGATPAGKVGDTPPGVFPYTFADIIKALNAVQPYNWAAFWTSRLTDLTPMPPTAGLSAAGYDYVHSPQMLKVEADALARYKFADFRHSLGFLVTADNTLSDVWMQSPAWTAGLSTGDKLVSVNGKPFSAGVLNSAVTQAATDKKPIELTAEKDGEKKAVSIAYFGGLQYSSYHRNSNPDVLVTAIFKAR